MKQLLSKGLEQTAALWSPIIIAYDWVHHAAQILDNHAQFDAPIVQLCLSALIEAMSVHQTSAGYLLEGVIHFLKVTASYWSGLFCCYWLPGLPRTNNDLEHIFGTVRHHHRRCTGRTSRSQFTCITWQCSRKLLALLLNSPPGALNS